MCANGTSSGLRRDLTESAGPDRIADWAAEQLIDQMEDVETTAVKLCPLLLGWSINPILGVKYR